MCGMKLHSTEYFLSNQLFIFFVAEHVEILLRNIRFIEKIVMNCSDQHIFFMNPYN